jgi:hypothetical protein
MNITVKQILDLLVNIKEEKIFLTDGKPYTMFLNEFRRRYSSEHTICQGIGVDNDRVVIYCEEYKE